MNRKAQVTMFIILGLLIVLAASLYFFSKQEDIKILPKQTVPEEISPIKRFVEECVYESGFTGLQNIGDTGGYIEYPIEILNNPRSYLKPIPVFPEIKKPYWWRDGKEIITSIPVMENQLEKFVAKDFVDCLNDFEDFKEQYEIEVLGEPTVEASINEEDVSFTLKYPINVKNKVFNKETKVKKYFTKVPVRLKPMFNLAKEIMDKENEGYFMEDFTIDLIALTPEEQIPYTGMDFKCGSKVWSGSVVQKRLKELLRFNIPLIRVNNTDYEPVPEDTPYVANHYIW